MSLEHEIYQLLAAAIKPDRALTVSQWSDEYRFLSSKDSSEPGRFRTARTPYLREIMDDLSNTSSTERVVFIAGAQVGKALCIHTPIITPEGFKPMGSLKQGDRVFDENGNPCNVTHAHDVLEGRTCYRVHFSDGTHIDCDEGHLWTVRKAVKGKNPQTVTLKTSEMLSCYKYKNRNNFSIPVAKPLVQPESDLPIDPYLLGVWLGDGSTGANALHLFEEDAMPIIGRIAMTTGISFRIMPTKARCFRIILDPKKGLADADCWYGHQSKKGKNGTCLKCSVMYTNKSKRGTQLQDRRLRFGEAIDAIGVKGRKHIPVQYLQASVSQRMDLLRGLMDTDGCVSKKGLCSFSSSIEHLAKDFYTLAVSLGFKPTVSFKKKVRNWNFNFSAYAENSPFHLERKSLRLRKEADGRKSESASRAIVFIEPIESKPVRCISVDSPSHLYLAGEQMVPTHNSTVGLNWLGYIMHISPGPILAVQPTVDIAKRFSKQRVATMIDETPVLKERAVDTKYKDSDNTILMKGFPGGTMMMAGANSAAGLRSMPIRYLFCDEIDAYPTDLDNEGSPLALAEKRTTTFNRRKIFLCSTPTIKDASAIELEFRKGDQQYFHVPCPHCNFMQKLDWKNLKWDEGNPDSTRYACIDCGVLIEERYKTKMLSAGQWVASKQGDGKTRSYHLNSLYSPLGWKSWSGIVRDFLQSKDDPVLLKTWVNTTLGETWEDQYSASLDPMNLMGRAEDYTLNNVPVGVIAVTCGVDVQDDRVAVSLYGFGESEETWVLLHQEIAGDLSGTEIWDSLDNVRHTPITRADGKKLSVLITAIDSGGHFTQTVYDYARQRRGAVIAVKGSSQAGKPIISKPSKVDFKRNGQTIKNGVELFMIGVDGAKATIYGRLRKTVGAGAWHFPKHLEQWFYNQLTSEKQIVRYQNGMPRKQWVKKDSARNEALDTAVYAYAALFNLYMKHNRATIWQTLSAELTNQEIITEVVVKDVPIVEKSEIQRKKASFWG